MVSYTDTVYNLRTNGWIDYGFKGPLELVVDGESVFVSPIDDQFFMKPGDIGTNLRQPRQFRYLVNLDNLGTLTGDEIKTPSGEIVHMAVREEAIELMYVAPM